ncbi:tetratricopeptide repeat (TPR)-like superfamily protein [Actinidia rufa]|uniref:Tetratricopeptide repeat (TPR)-like superfamily protein n=1 Tax=Actinidia rufa TaxID=165716 RepID=A0A7J0H766_9ERIC|nr:tetratricopeptide repeat (TPR)-like superfamily protein [Actinidia rufa]
MHRILANMCHCKSRIGSCIDTNLRSLCHRVRTISTLTNSIETRPCGSPRISFNTPVELHRLSHILQQSADSGDFRTGLSVHTRIVKLNLDGFASLSNKLLNLCCKCLQFGIARQVFDEMSNRDVVSFNTMISACVRCNHGLEAVYFYNKMIEENVKPNHITLAGLIGACGVLAASRLREVFHAQAIQCGLCSNEYVGCSLVNGYAEEMRLEDAIKAFGEIVQLDLVSWNIMIDGCVRNNSKEHALRVFVQMLQENVEYDGFTLTSMIKTCLEQEDMCLGKMLHCCAIKAGLTCETPICNALITMYSRCEGAMPSATKIFGNTLAPNIISWTAIITGFMQNKQNEEAIAFYQNMIKLGVRENDFCFASILSVYSNLANMEYGRQIHARIVKSCFVLDLSVNNALMDMYSKCGSLAEAHLVYRTMGKHDKVSCTTMITAFGHHGKGIEALGILHEMTREGLNPDDVTFLGCLFACSHGGHLDEGIMVFRTMIDVYNLKPRREHFSCVVDMLGRAGRLVEAEKFIEEMGIGSDVFVWETLLSACRLHGEMGLGEKSVKKIIELQSCKHGPYVLLANMYADQGLWEDKGVVLESLIANGLKNESGCSWVA